MSLSEKLEGVKFSKRIAGYSVKEVNGFFGDMLPIALEQEQEIKALRAKLDAYESRADEIAKQENEARLILEDAKNESERIIAKANENAAEIVEKAKANAVKIIYTADEKAKETVSLAKNNAEAILDAADKKGNAILADVNMKAELQNAKTRALTAEYDAFETRFRTLVAETASSLAALRNDTPRVEIKGEETASPRRISKVRAGKEAETAAEKTEPAPVHTPSPAAAEPRDFGFAGGKPLSEMRERTAETSRRKMYDTVTVSYDVDDGFDDIRKLKEESGGSLRKSPTHFSE